MSCCNCGATDDETLYNARRECRGVVILAHRGTQSRRRANKERPPDLHVREGDGRVPGLQRRRSSKKLLGLPVAGAPRIICDPPEERTNDPHSGHQNHHQRGGRYGARNHRGKKSGSAQRLKGCFADGIWHCNCTPRLPAANFTVKKEGANKGRNFYTCQENEPKRCDFFLWAEDAKLREEAAVMANSRNEPGRDAEAQEGWTAGRNAAHSKGLFSTPAPGRTTVDDEAPTPTPSPPPPSTDISRKRKMSSDGEDPAFAISGEEEDAMARVAAATPQKASQTGVYATPVTEKRSVRTLPWLNQEPVTPASTAKKTVVDYFNNGTTPSKRAKTVSFEEPLKLDVKAPETPGAATTAAVPSTPSPIRQRDALVNPADSASLLTNEVLGELSSVKIPPETMSRLRSIVSKHDLRTQGITKGRDISRLALKAKEAKITELEARIASLEAEREHDRGIIARLRWRQENGQEEEDESQL